MSYNSINLQKFNQLSFKCLFVICGIVVTCAAIKTSSVDIIDLLIPRAMAAPGDGKIYFFHNDHLGTPKAMTNEQGVKVWSAEHGPYGKATVNTDVDGDGEHVEMNARFPGQYNDDETGLHYNYFRYYNPSTGRYMTSDPIGLNGGLNKFGYVGGNPVNRVDPDGLRPTKNPKGPDGKPRGKGCVTTCATDFVGMGMLTSVGGAGVGRLLAKNTASTLAQSYGSSYFSISGAFDLSACLDSCDDDDDEDDEGDDIEC